MSLKSSKLKDAVYYLIVENTTNQDKNFVLDVTQSLAAELMMHGARVYVMGKDVSNGLAGDGIASGDPTGDYIRAINKRYLQNSGKYQRVLVIRAENVSERSNMDVAVYHYNKSTQGQRFAQNLQNVFKENNISNRSVDQASLIFEDQTSLYLAKNILPAISLLKLKNASNHSDGKIFLKPNKKEFANLVSNGILNDYAGLEMEN